MQHPERQARPIETAPKDGARILLKVDLAGQHIQNAALEIWVFAYWRYSTQDWELSPYAEGASIEKIYGWLDPVELFGGFPVRFVQPEDHAA